MGCSAILNNIAIQNRDDASIFSAETIAIFLVLDMKSSEVDKFIIFDLLSILTALKNKNTKDPFNKQIIKQIWPYL